MATGKLWAGSFHAALDATADDFNSSIRFDKRMFREDIAGSVAHAEMLGRCGILSAEDVLAITEGLSAILADLESGKCTVDGTAEDIHSFVEGELTARIGEAGKRLHTARSRNDQVATDLRLYLRTACAEVRTLIRELVAAVLAVATANADTVVPGYTHLQRAQPITFGHHLMAYAMMLTRDDGRIADAVARMNVSPLGCCALAGTTYAIDRESEAAALGFDGIALNSLDGVSDRDYCVELESAFALLMAHLSRFAEELILWSSREFGYVTLSDAYTTGSSIMPQKKNPDMAELIRGKTGRVYGDLMATLTMLKGLPLAYNKDMQEDKEAVFDSLDTVTMCLRVMAPMVATMTVHADAMYEAAQTGFINATDVADYLVKKGRPFRTAYKTVGDLVAYCTENKKALDELTLDVYKRFDDLFDADLYGEISLAACVAKRVSAGGTSKASFEAQKAYIEAFLQA